MTPTQCSHNAHPHNAISTHTMLRIGTQCEERQNSTVTHHNMVPASDSFDQRVRHGCLAADREKSIFQNDRNYFTWNFTNMLWGSRTPKRSWRHYSQLHLHVKFWWCQGSLKSYWNHYNIKGYPPFPRDSSIHTEKVRWCAPVQSLVASALPRAMGVEADWRVPVKVQPVRNFASSQVALLHWLVLLVYAPPLEALGSVEQLLLIL